MSETKIPEILAKYEESLARARNGLGSRSVMEIYKLIEKDILQAIVIPISLLHNDHSTFHSGPAYPSIQDEVS